MQVIWSPASLHEVMQIYLYIADFNRDAASRLMDALTTAGNSLGAFPRRGRPVGDNLRELTLVHPYIIRYEIVEELVVILRVRHGMRQG